MPEGIDLFQLFNTVTGALSDKRDSLNVADDHNQNHGDNMVQIFEVITRAMKEKQGSDPADQLQYASDLLRGASNSGSAQMYVQGLSSASQQFKGKKGLSHDSILPLIQMLLNGGEAASSSGTGDMLGSLLSGLSGGSGEDKSDVNMGDLLSAGMAFLNAKEGGGNTVEALIETLVSETAMGQSNHRAQSGQVVANTVLQLLSGLAK